MKFQIIKSPNSYLLLELSKNEKIIIEKGCLIYSDGEYNFENKIEVESYKNIISKILGGKSLTYNYLYR
ncbi:MAG: AIM24 family protein [Cytophagales bacterium]